MPARQMGKVVAELIFLLIANHGECGDRSDERIVAKCILPGNCARSDGEGKVERKAVVLVADFGAMQNTGVKGKRTEP